MIDAKQNIHEQLLRNSEIELKISYIVKQKSLIRIFRSIHATLSQIPSSKKIWHYITH